MTAPLSLAERLLIQAYHDEKAAFAELRPGDDEPCDAWEGRLDTARGAYHRAERRLLALCDERGGVLVTPARRYERAGTRLRTTRLVSIDPHYYQGVA